MTNAGRCLVLLISSFVALFGCQARPLTPTQIQDQQRFEVGCRAEGAEGLEHNMPYCGHDGGSRIP
jgi:hypothetical protein